MRFWDEAQINCCAMSLKFHVDHWHFLALNRALNLVLELKQHAQPHMCQWDKFVMWCNYRK